MFIRIKKISNTTKTCVQLISNKRRGKKVKQTIIRHFGTASNDNEVNILKKMAEILKAEILKENDRQFLFPDINLNEKIQICSENDNKNSESLIVDLFDLDVHKIVHTGITKTYGKIYNEIGFGDVISEPSKRSKSIKTLFNIVMDRISNPVSKRESVFQLKEEHGVNVNLTSVYYMMNYLDDAAIERIKQASFNYVQGLFNEKLNVIFYDCTTLYFENFVEDDLRKKGFSKDRKSDQCQVLLAIMVTSHGLPVGYELFDGSKYEGHTIDSALKRLHEKYAINKVIFAADAGMLNKENIKKFLDAKQNFLVGARIKNLKKEDKEKITDLSNYKPINENNNEEKVLFYETILPDTGLRLVMTYSPKRAKKDKQDREDAAKKANEKTNETKNPKDYIANSSYKKFIKIEGKSKIDIDKEKMKEEAKWDGLHGIVTNIEASYDVKFITEVYRSLWLAEETFRLVKHDGRIRPIYHWTTRRIKAHIAICYMALTCMRVMEYKVCKEYKKMSSKAIKSELNKLAVIVLIEKNKNRVFGLPFKITETAKKIFDILGLKWVNKPFEIK